MKTRRAVVAISQKVLALGLVVGFARADSLAVVAVDSSFTIPNVLTSLVTTGRFTTVDLLDPASATFASQLSAYSDVLVWTSNPPPAGFGDTLADFYDLGGKSLTIAGFAFSVPNPIFVSPLLTGRVATGDYAGFALPTDTSKTNGVQTDGSLVSTPAGLNDPIFSGIDLNTVFYDANPSLANPQLAAGATLLATDGGGVDMIARSKNGVIDINVYPAGNIAEAQFHNNQALFNLIANTFPAAAAPPPTPDVPETSSLAAMAVVAGLLALVSRRNRTGLPTRP
ncbi:MAG: hypothetical protein LAP40_13235 [Acidobacteriia bacterium]|nr:hypothetical protein [Terriglobia bacterium]